MIGTRNQRTNPNPAQDPRTVGKGMTVQLHCPICGKMVWWKREEVGVVVWDGRVHQEISAVMERHDGCAGEKLTVEVSVCW